MLFLLHEKEKFISFFKGLTNHFQLDVPKAKANSYDRFNFIFPWYAQNMLVHYLSPHGLEQYGGAAWGTRDVCQGPLEFFLATNHGKEARELLTILFQHQFVEDGSWPQWFMFDEYASIYSDECHGDVIVWPLKALGSYLEKTGDFSILDEKVPYMSDELKAYTSKAYTIEEHVRKELAYITSHFYKNTYLSQYGNGDWDDTLQPANPALKKDMVSSWTVALTYQAIHNFSEAIAKEKSTWSQELKALNSHIQKDIEKYILGCEVTPGFLVMKDTDDVEYIIHPNDKKTGIQYRLIPMNRLMISELYSPQQAKDAYELIQKHLKFKDGIRLMNHPPKYNGGISLHFKRAEQASNFGREIGLLYEHAQIRYAEAMAKTNHCQDAWEALEQIVPINIQEIIPNAVMRQSNAYFSSSDGDFKTRYEAYQSFDKLRSGEIPVKGGWRVYSSGPGIFVNQFITNILGIKETYQGLTLDGCLPEDVDEYTVHYVIYGFNTAITYRRSTHGQLTVSINGKDVVGQYSVNRYGKEEVFISLTEVFKHLSHTGINNIIINK